MSQYVDVTVCQGILRGYVEWDSTDLRRFVAFRGIPYAKPPIGKRRFKDPEPAEPWINVRDALNFSQMSPQYDLFSEQLIGSEDCLYLNVYTQTIDVVKKCAVMVWIHGGSFNSGSGSSDIYGPDYIVAHNVVLVIINYRLGAFGFLNLDSDIAPGNQGLKDALMALQWVHDNISSFGGDPENVTIFGQGSGGAMVHYLAVCPQADGLFHKAISQSGTAANTWAFAEKETQKARCFQLVEKLGGNITDTKEAVKFLRSIDTISILEATIDIQTRNEKLLRILPFLPTEDSDSSNPFFEEHPAIMLRRGVKVPFIIGFTSCEGSVFAIDLDDEDLEQLNSDFTSIIHPRIWPTLMQKSITADDIRFRYFGNELLSMKTIWNYTNLLGDMHFYSGIFETASIQAQLGLRSTYVYKFSHVPKCSLPKLLIDLDIGGAFHGEEVSYLLYPRLCTHMKSQLGIDLGNDPERSEITERMTQMWTDFAKTGNPTPALTSLIPIKWTPLEREDKFPFLIMDTNFAIETVRNAELNFFGVM